MADVTKIAYVKQKLSILNIIEILGIQFIILFTLSFQVFFHDLPCPLCLLQRIGFFGITIGLLMNLRFGFKPCHYSIILLSAFFTSHVALRQVVMNMVPDGGYGSPFLGLYLYTWSFIISTIILIYTAMILGIKRQFKRSIYNMKSHGSTYTLLAITTLIFAANLILQLKECGFGPCH